MLNRIIKGIGLLILLSWFNRILGFFSIIILARILQPEAFGVMAIIILALQFTETLTDIGSEQYFIQKNNTTVADLNCAWSSNLLIKILTTLLFAIFSPLIAGYFELDHLTYAFLIISTFPTINALNNGWILQLKKNIDYKKITQVAAVSKLLGNVASITLALILQSYWALIIGTLLSSSLHVLFSYIFIQQRAMFDLTHWREQFQFSKWVVAKGVIGHIRAKFDSWFAMNIQGLTGLGAYNVSKDLVLLPSREFLSPISHVFFTAIAQSSNYSDEQQLKIRKALTIITIIAFPIAAGWDVIATPFVHVVLGEQWLPHIPVIASLGALVVTFSIGNFISQLMTATGNVKSLFYYDVVTLAISLIVLIILIPYITNIEILARYRIYIGLGIITIGAIWLSMLNIVPLRHFIKATISPCIMAFLTMQIIQYIPLDTYDMLTTLIITITSAIVLYTTSIFLGCKMNLFGRVESSFLQQLIREQLTVLITRRKNI